MQRQGVSESEAVFTFTLIQNLEHKIRAACGASDTTYGGKIWAIPMQGIYQGDSGGPTIWALVSLPLLQIMKEEGFGTFFKASITSNTLHLVGSAFNNNTDLIQTGKDGLESSLEVLQQMQEGINLWEGLFRATGGAKSPWWLIDFIWENDGQWQYATKEDIPAKRFVKDMSGDCRAVPGLETSKAFATLCVHLSPDRSQLATYDHLLDTAKSWAGKLWTSFLKELEANTTLKTTILKNWSIPHRLFC
jgi:hypothetical protein